MTNILIKNFKQLSKGDAEIAGGKGASLGEMTNASIPVPFGYVVLSEAFESFLIETDLNVEIDSILETVDLEKIHTIEQASSKIQALILNVKMPDNIKIEINKHFKKLDSKYVAVRSSATSEDSADAAWAGQLDSFLNTTSKTLLENVQKCWASLFTPRAIFYRFEKNLHNHKINVAVVVQKMIDSEISGIAFSVHPITEDPNQLIIEAGYGLGEAIVSGQVTPDSYVVEKDPQRIIDKNISQQKRAIVKVSGGGNKWKDISESKQEKQKLTDEEIIKLTNIIEKIEKHYGFPCDIEWAMVDNKFYITQSRPITTLMDVSISSKKDKTPIYRKVMDFPFIPVTTWEYGNCSLANNPYLKKMKIKKYPGAITFQKNKCEYWIDESTVPVLTDKKLINKIVSDTTSITKNELKPIQKFIATKNQTSKDYLKEFRRLNKLLLELCYGYSFFTDEWIVTEDKKLLKTLPEVRIKLSDFISNFWGAYLKIMKFMEVEYNISMKELDNCTSEEIENMLQGKEIDRKGLKTRPFALIIKDNKIEKFKGKEAQDIKKFLDKQNPSKKSIKEAKNKNEISGNTANKGKAKGEVIVVTVEDYNNYEKLLKGKKNYILVTPMTRPEIVPFLNGVKAIITDEGGITCHAAIVSRELKLPCIIGTKIATQVIKNGDVVEVDADNGVIKILKKVKK